MKNILKYLNITLLIISLTVLIVNLIKINELKESNTLLEKHLKNQREYINISKDLGKLISKFDVKVKAFTKEKEEWKKTHKKD